MKMYKKLTLSFIGSSIILYFLFPTEKEIAINFYDKNFLRNSTAVEKVLKKQGFTEVNCLTHDNLTINTIMLDRHTKHDIQATIISMPGFIPGRKEGMSTLYDMLKEYPYNFLFIDSRGHGKSDGQLLTYQGIKNYGATQYLDIIAALEYVYTYNKKHNIQQNIIIHGLCSGAFHTVKAVTYVEKHNQELYHAIKGIILDSAWPSIPSIVETVLQAETHERCKQVGMPFLQPYLAYVLVEFYNYLFKDAHLKQEPITNTIGCIKQPILFIHSQADVFVPIKLIEPLMNNAQLPCTWFVHDAPHVNTHLMYKDEYKSVIQNFIDHSMP